MQDKSKKWLDALTKIILALAALIRVKTIVTFAIVGVFVVQALKGELSSEVLTITSTVIAFYFGTQYEKNQLK